MADRRLSYYYLNLLLPIILIVLSTIEQQRVDAAACKGCTPPCICPGRKGEKVCVVFIDRLDLRRIYIYIYAVLLARK
jgi:hypothetical protein